MSEVVTTLRPKLNTEERAYMAMHALASTCDELEALAQEDPEGMLFYLPELDDHDTWIRLFIVRLRMKKTTTHLCSQFGRP